MTIMTDRPLTIRATDGNPNEHWTGADPTGPWVSLARELAPALAEHAADRDEDGLFVHDSYELLRDRGLLAMLIPTELGGGGATHGEACAVLSELAHGCPATSLAFSMHTHVVAAQVWRHHRDLPAPVLARVVSDRVVLVSTGGSDWIDSNGTAVRVEGGFRITARKQPASGCEVGDILVTSARWEDGPDGPQVIHASVPFAAPGVIMERSWNTMGMRGTGSHTMVLDDVFVPDAAIALTRPAGAWHPIWSTVLGVALPIIMSSYVGVAEAAAERAIALAGRRAERPDVAPLVGRMLNRLAVARDAVRSMIDASADIHFDNTLPHAAMSLTRKSIATDAAIETVRVALDVAGGAAYTRDAGIERLYRDVHGALYHPLPTAQQERFTGRIALGLDPLG